MKDCKKIHPLLSLYLDKRLSTSEATRVESHLKDCADARKELKELQRLRDVMIALPEPKLPHDLHQRIMAKVQGRPVPLHPARPFWVFPAGALAAAAVVAVFLFVQNPDLMNFTNQKNRDSFSEQKGLAPINSPNSRASENLKTRPKQSTLGVQSYAPSQPQNFEPSLAKDAKTAPAPEAQMAVAPRAKEKRASKKAAKMEMAMGETQPREEAAGAPAGAALDGTPASPLAFTGATTVGQAFDDKENKNLALDSSAAKANLPAAQASAPAPAAQPANTPTPVTSWAGNFNPSTPESQELVTDEAAFQKDWQAFMPGQTPPSVDFTSQAVVVLMDQERPTAGYSIHVTNLEEKPDQLVVHYKVDAPSAGSFNEQVLTRPWTLQIIPKPAKPVTFQKD